jgi:hypothetical protein
MDTKYFAAALDEFSKTHPGVTEVRFLRMDQLSSLLLRAQELKDADAAARAEERGSRHQIGPGI